MSERKIIAVTGDWKNFGAFLEELDEALTELAVPHYLPSTNGETYAIVLGSEPFTKEDAEIALGL